MYDAVTGGEEFAAVSASGVRANGYSAGGMMSADGRYVVFQSSATNLVAEPTVTGPHSQVFVRDRRTGAVEVVSVSGDGGAADLNVNANDISADGRYVVYDTMATNLGHNRDLNNNLDVYLRDRLIGVTERISVTSAGADAGPSSYGSHSAAVSADGRFVAFASDFRLSPNDLNTASDVYLRDRYHETTTLISRGAVDSGASVAGAGALSHDGRVLVFHESAKAYVWRAGEGATLIEYPEPTVSVYPFSVSADGTRTAVRADVLVQGHPVPRIAVINLRSLTIDSSLSGFSGWDPVLSCDGSRLATSSADRLASGDSDNAPDVYLVTTPMPDPDPFSLSPYCARLRVDASLRTVPEWGR